MVDPFTIIGTTSAVLSFAQFAGNVVSTAYGLYSSSSESTEENAGIEDVTRKMTTLLDDLQAQVDSKSQSSQEGSIVHLAAHCRSLGEKIISLLKKTKTKKTKKTHSLRECIRATTATVWTKGVISDLRKELEFCMNQLSLHLATIFRYCDTHTAFAQPSIG
jgi:hypothetical protein